jgi:rare lipoprotein A
VRPRRAEQARALAPGVAVGALLVLVVFVVVGAVLFGCATDAEARRRGDIHTLGGVEEGRASFYGAEFNGRRTASGERYDPRKLTAAHKSLPLGTRLRVTRVGGGNPSVEVRVNDRCGCAHGRIVDLSLAAARRLDMVRAGVVPVRVEVLSKE